MLLPTVDYELLGYSNIMSTYYNVEAMHMKCVVLVVDRLKNNETANELRLFKIMKNTIMACKVVAKSYN